MLRTTPWLLAATLLIPFGPSVAEAKYRPLPLNEMIQKADLIVVGEITALGDSTYEFRIDRVLHGEPPAPKTPLTVQRFQDWPCAARWAPYAVGQKLVLCLGTVADEAGKFLALKPLGAGDEGELPMLDGNVHVHGPAALKMPRGEFELYGKKISAYQVPLESFAKMVTAIRRKTDGVTE